MLLVFTALITASVFGFAGAALSSVGQAWFALFAALISMAAFNVFGEEAYNTVRNIRSGEDEEE